MSDEAAEFFAAANLAARAGRAQDALAGYASAIASDPSFAAAYVNRAAVLLSLRDHAGALAAADAAAKAFPAFAPAFAVAGEAALAAGLPVRAEEALRAALACDPALPGAANNLALAVQGQGRIAEALEIYRRARAAAPHDPVLASNDLMCAQYDGPDGDGPDADRLARARAWPAARPDAARPAAAALAGRRLRIGYASPDFCSHSCSYFLVPLLAGHDRAKVELFAYSDVAVPDGVTAGFRGLVPNWRDVRGASDADFVAAVRGDRIDVLVDCAGHTAGNRLAAFARRPAPVQFTWLGYPGTTGLSCFDARLVDAITDPPGAADAAASEKLARLAGGFLAYMPAPFAPAVGPLPMLESGVPTFGSFNNLPKITGATVALWAGVLRAVPAARLLIKARGLGEPVLRDRLLARFAAAGIAGGRVLAAGFDSAVQDHIARYNAIDVALDTTPYNGTTTTCEALWMGVPVVTLTGARHAARVGTSLLSHLGRCAWAASDAAAFAAAAARLVADPPRLAAIRAGLRAEMAASPLCDGARLARSVEALCETTWRRVVNAA